MRIALLFFCIPLLQAAAVEPGELPSRWRSGGPDCSAVPDWQVHKYNQDFYILRQSGCTHYEKPFLYLIFGKDQALLEDTGAGQPKTAEIVMDLVAKWSQARGRKPVPLLVVHSHSHGDHVAGDSQFEGLPNVRMVKARVEDIQSGLGMRNWPVEIGKIDLGGRVIDVIPIPGHDKASVAYYDRRTGILLTGDSFYAGRLYVGGDMFTEFAASHQRMVTFVKGKPVSHILGTHIEQTRTPFKDYPRGTTYQPDEASLELTIDDLIELNQALTDLGGRLKKVELKKMTIYPRF